MASYLGKGFYTIGPCGEELLGLTSLHMTDKDLVALHYRHVANSVVRGLMAGSSASEIALNRARGFACSVLDPVTGGRHCSIGGNFDNEFIVTSTLASQATPALGRALAISYSQPLLGSEAKFAPNALSYVSLGDGSASNAHFLSAMNMARYAQHNKLKCPLLFVVTDNNISISLRGQGFVRSVMDQLQGIQKESADGQDFLDLYDKSGRMMEYVRTMKRPGLLYINNLPRRFGHAATDRQFAYYSEKEISGQMEQNPLSATFSILRDLGVYSDSEIETLFQSLQEDVSKAFDIATEEPKISSRRALVATNSGSLYLPPSPSSQQQPPAIVTRVLTPPTPPAASPAAGAASTPPAEVKEVMRKHMTRLYHELFEKHKDIVYLGEDVRHGGYYLVTDGLAAKYPTRVLDFPPDETSLIGVGMGFAQSGLTTIVEIPYAKYLDCGIDIMYEAVISHWLSNGQQPTGLLLRLQGFDRGIFGGNYHTHNLLTFQAPGLDVVCFSNGKDYVRGMRFLIEQVRHSKRVVMVVDSTDLLNRRHVNDQDKDEYLLHVYPKPDECESYDFDQIIVYPSPARPPSPSTPNKRRQVVIVSYGNGIPTSLQAQKILAERYADMDVVVLDTPCLSQTPSHLKSYVRMHREDIACLVFADVCKYTPSMPLAKMAVDLQNEDLFSTSTGSIKWKVIGAAPTYNPLGSYLTFLSQEDIVSATHTLVVPGSEDSSPDICYKL